MKICHVINSLNRGGAESHLLELAKAQNNEGLLIDIVVIGKDNKNIFSIEIIVCLLTPVFEAKSSCVKPLPFL